MIYGTLNMCYEIVLINCKMASVNTTCMSADIKNKNCICFESLSHALGVII